MNSKLFIQAMDEEIAKSKEQHTDVAIEENDKKDLYRKNAYNELIKVDPTLGDNIFNRLLVLIKENGLDINNMYMFNDINEKLNSLYKLKSLDDTVPLPDINRNITAPVTKEELDVTPDVQQSVPVADVEVDYKTIEIADPEEVSAIKEPDKIVNDTMELVAEEVRDIVNEENKQPVDSKSESITPLTTNEKISMAEAIDKVQENLEIENKYLGLLDGVEGWTFDSPVRDIDGNNIIAFQGTDGTIMF